MDGLVVGDLGLGCFQVSGGLPLIADRARTATITALSPCKLLVLHKDEADRKLHEQMGFHEGWNTALDQLIAEGGTEQQKERWLWPNLGGEIRSADLSGLLLDCASWGVTDPSVLSWLDPPPAAALAVARAELAGRDGVSWHE